MKYLYTHKKLTKTFIMKKAWFIAHTASRLFGGSPRDYFAGSLKMSWEFARKASLSSDPVKVHMEEYSAWYKTVKRHSQLDKNCYTVLGVKFPSTIRDVKKAYKRLALINHPDKGDNHYSFIQIKDAYEQCMKQLRFH